MHLIKWEWGPDWGVRSVCLKRNKENEKRQKTSAKKWRLGKKNDSLIGA